MVFCSLILTEPHTNQMEVYDRENNQMTPAYLNEIFADFFNAIGIAYLRISMFSISFGFAYHARTFIPMENDIDPYNKLGICQRSSHLKICIHELSIFGWCYNYDAYM